MEGPSDGQLLDDLAEPAPRVYVAGTYPMRIPLTDEPLKPADEAPEAVSERHYYRLVDEPQQSHRRWLSEREIPDAEWSSWAFYVHAPELGSP